MQKDDAATAFLEQMCDELDVDLFFNGHIHNYFRATVDGNGKKAEPREATTFITTSPMGTKFDDYGGEIDDVLSFQTGGQKDERQYFTYVEVTEDGINVTAYQRSEAGDANKKNCSDYRVIDRFSIAAETGTDALPSEAPDAPPAEEPTGTTNPESGAAPEKKGVSPIVWVLIGAGAAVAIAAVVVVLRKRKKTEKV